MKKTTLMMLASATMLLAVPATERAAQSGTHMGKSLGQGKYKKNRKCQCNKVNSPFLIKQGLPHLMKRVMKNINDKSLALTPAQKEQLSRVKTKSKSSIKETAVKIKKLREEIIRASTSGTSARDIKRSVEKLAILEAYATMIQLQCIEDTKAILTKDQLFYLLSNKKQWRKGMQKPRGNQRNMR